MFLGCPVPIAASLRMTNLKTKVQSTEENTECNDEEDSLEDEYRDCKFGLEVHPEYERDLRYEDLINSPFQSTCGSGSSLSKVPSVTDGRRCRGIDPGSRTTTLCKLEAPLRWFLEPQATTLAPPRVTTTEQGAEEETEYNDNETNEGDVTRN